MSKDAEGFCAKLNTQCVAEFVKNVNVRPNDGGTRMLLPRSKYKVVQPSFAHFNIQSLISLPGASVYQSKRLGIH